jgi:UDP-glucose 4-epimerase
MTRILITGGAGFIGSHIARAWLQRGAHVTIVDNFRTGKRENLSGLDVRLIEGSVEDRRLMAEAAKGVTYIHHLAALVSVPESMNEPELTERINVGGTLSVLAAAKEACVQKVVFSSTSAVYGMAERPIHHEHHLPEPASPYAISKLSGEHYMRLYNGAFGVPTVVLRYFNVYGPRQDPKSPYAAAVAIFSDKAAANEPLTIFGDGEQTRDFVFVEDVAAANLLVAEKATGLFNVASGNRITVKDLAREIIHAAGSSSVIRHAPERPGDVKHSRGAIDRIRGLGWEPRMELGEGLRQTLAVVSQSR